MLFPLVIAALPGVFRVLYMALAERSMTIKEFGEMNSDLSIASIFAFFTAVGVGSIVFARSPKLGKSESMGFLNRVLRYTLYLLGLSVAVSILVYFMEGIFDLYSFLMFLCGWSIYQVLRNYFLSLKMYMSIVKLDCILICTFLCASFLLYKSNGVSLLFIFGFSYVFSGLIIHRWKISKSLSRSDQKLVWRYGGVNFMSGAVYMAVIPFSGMLYGIEYAGIAGYLFSLVNVLVLLPRAMSNYFMPAFSIGKEMESKYNKFSILVLLSLIFSFSIIYFIFSGVHGYILNGSWAGIDVISVFEVILLSVFCQQLSLIPSSLISSREKTVFMLILNFIFLLLSAFLFVFEMNNRTLGFNNLMLYLAYLSLIRYVFLELYSRIYLNRMEFN